MEAAAHLEIDAVIDPADTRTVILQALSSAPDPEPKIDHGKRGRFVDTW